MLAPSLHPAESGGWGLLNGGGDGDGGEQAAELAATVVAAVAAVEGQPDCADCCCGDASSWRHLACWPMSHLCSPQWLMNGGYCGDQLVKDHILRWLRPQETQAYAPAVLYWNQR